MQFAAICYLIREMERRTEVCLSRKKRGYGEGLLHAYGGVLQPLETPRRCAARETFEESSAIVHERSLNHIARVTTYAKNHLWRVQVFTCTEWRGSPGETEEQGPPEWYALDRLPFGQMFPDRKYWLYRALSKELLNVEMLVGPEGRDVHLAYFRKLAEAA